MTYTLRGFDASSAPTKSWTPEASSYYVSRPHHFGLTAGVTVTSVYVRERLTSRASAQGLLEGFWGVRVGLQRA